MTTRPEEPTTGYIRCTSQACPQSDTCYRKTEPQCIGQGSFEYTPGESGECAAFIPDDRPPLETSE